MSGRRCKALRRAFLEAEGRAPEGTRCAACCLKRPHTTEDWKNHPYAGHGYSKETGYTHPDLEPKLALVRLLTADEIS